MEKKMRDLCKEVELWLKRYFPFCLKMLKGCLRYAESSLKMCWEVV